MKDGDYLRQVFDEEAFSAKRPLQYQQPYRRPKVDWDHFATMIVMGLIIVLVWIATWAVMSFVSGR